MSELPSDDLEQQLRAFYRREHGAPVTPETLWPRVAARIIPPAEGKIIMQPTPQISSSTNADAPRKAAPDAKPPRRLIPSGAVALAVVILLALFARAVFANHPNNAGTSSTLTPTDTLVMSGLSGISMVSPTDGWAVGSTQTLSKAQQAANLTPPTHPLLFHYVNGVWQEVDAPNGLDGVQLQTVAMLNAHDGWAAGGYDAVPASVGGYVDAPQNKSAVMLHYDGTSWQMVSIPQTQNLIFQKIRFISPQDGWALASSSIDGGQIQIFHWHGGTWHPEATQQASGYVQSVDLSMVSPQEGWAAVNTAPSVKSGPLQGLLLHYHTGRWTAAKTLPGIILSGIALTATGEGWATGVSQNDAVLLHYSNGAWHRMPKLTANDSYYGPITLPSATQGWFPFSRGVPGTTPVTFGLYHYDGTTWKVAPINNLTLEISAGAFTSAQDGWFVGDASTGKSLNGTIGYGYAFAHYANDTLTEYLPQK